MVRNCIESSDTFWSILFHLEDLKAPMSLTNFLEKYELSKDQFFIFLELSHSYGLVVNIKEEEQGAILFPLSWHKEFEDFVIQKTFYKEMVGDLQNCIENTKTCMLKFKSDLEMELLPWRLLFFENNLVLIAEEIKTKRLLTIEVVEIVEMEIRRSDYHSPFSRFEVEDFVNAMRLVDGSDERLVIKIHYGAEISMPSDYIFLGNPYTTTNQYGDIIWAATVEPSDPLYEWLFAIKDNVDILDPSSIKNEFEKFCENKLAQKKAA